jgi:hypothetical protein
MPAFRGELQKLFTDAGLGLQSWLDCISGTGIFLLFHFSLWRGGWLGVIK